MNNLEIILVTYNRKKYLQNTLDQILADNSPIKTLPITILDNKSTDGTSEIIEEYRQKFSNIKHIIHNRNIGGNANIARAFEIAKKKYVWVLCDDDYYDFSSFKTVEEKLSKDIYDAIFMVSCENNIADMFYQATFVPACIYNTEKITNSVMENIFCNIPNLFPHLSVIAKIINDNGKVATLGSKEAPIVTVGPDNKTGNFYLRDIDDDDLNIDRRHLYWFIGYINSLKLIKEKAKRTYIINHTKHYENNIFELMILKLWINMRFYNFYAKNFRDIYFGLNFYQKIFIYIPCFVMAFFKYVLGEKGPVIDTIDAWQKYIKKHNILSKIDNKLKKYNGKKILLYGTGLVTQALLKEDILLLEKFDAISDKKIEQLQKHNDSNFYEVPPSEIDNFGADVIFVSVYKFDIIEKYLKKLGIKCKMEKII